MNHRLARHDLSVAAERSATNSADKFRGGDLDGVAALSALAESHCPGSSLPLLLGTAAVRDRPQE